MPHFHLTAAILIVLSTATVAPGWAQDTRDTTTRLEHITVTATGVPISRDALASSVTVLYGEDLRAKGFVQLLDALREVPGLSIAQNGSFGMTASLFTRGGESDYTKVLIDGVPVNLPGGGYDFAHLSTANIERVEILRGPASVLYGSDATTGVIQIFTRTGTGSPKVSGGMKGGTYASFDVDADLVGGSRSVDYSLGVRYFTTQGTYDFNNAYQNAIVSGRMVIRPDDVSDVALSLRYRDSETHFPTDGSGVPADRNAFSVNEATAISIDAGRHFADWVEVRMSLRSNLVDAGTDDAADDAADTLGFYAFRSIQDVSRQSVTALSNFYPSKDIVLTGGLEFEEEKERGFNESESEFGPSNGSFDASRGNWGYYAQAILDVAGASLVAGGRIDDNERFGTFATYRLAAAYMLPTATKLRGSVGRAFKEPTFFENFATGFAVGNPELVPERSTSWEAGVEQSVAQGRAAFTAVYFSQRFRDLIQFTFAETPNFVNVAAADASGIELEATGRPVRGVRLAGNYTYVKTEVVDSGVDSGSGASFVEGERLLRRPTHTLSLGADFDGWERGAFGLAVTYVGDADDRDFSTFPATPVTLSSYTLVDVTAQINVLPARAATGLVGTLRIENLLNEQYSTTFGFPARGRTVFVGARVER